MEKTASVKKVAISILTINNKERWIQGAFFCTFLLGFFSLVFGIIH
jgi:MFS superfamily sulfate permease-like transporter